MASTQRCLKIPADLAEAAEIRSDLLRYRSWGSYIKGLIRYDLTALSPHDLTLPISFLSLDEQALVDAALLAVTRKGVGVRGALLKGILQHMDGGHSIAVAIALADVAPPQVGLVIKPRANVTRGRTLKISADLAEAAEIRARSLKYPSWGAYIKGLIRYDLMVQGPHDHTLPIANLPLAEQDRLDAELLKATKSGVAKRGQLLKRIKERLQMGERSA